MVIILTFIGLLLLITAAAALLSYGAEMFAEKFGVNFTGSIVLALITTLPEYLFVIWASLKGQYAMAIGSAVGACSLLVTLGYGMVILLATSKLSKKPVKIIHLSENTKVDALYLLITAVIAFALAIEGGNSYDLKDSIILVGLFFIYMYHIATIAIKFYKEAQKKAEGEYENVNLLKSIIFLLVGGIIIFLCSEPFVDSMIEFAHVVGISPVIIAILLGPIASEMPEKITAYITVLRNGELAEISISNFIGSKVNHNSLLLGTIGLVALYKGSGIVHGIITPSFIYMTILTVFATISLARGKLARWQGWVFVGFYFGTVILAFLNH
ncbi:MAG: hypothetical protein KKH91_02355 [Elusimicrobia bacterium]|nr:hypothetical protein [Elusimicrobiota bacterium]MBU2614400.1 hypothetical protein [Elusimicrobiota bacterium]